METYPMMALVQSHQLTGFFAAMSALLRGVDLLWRYEVGGRLGDVCFEDDAQVDLGRRSGKESKAGCATDVCSSGVAYVAHVLRCPFPRDAGIMTIPSRLVADRAMMWCVSLSPLSTPRARNTGGRGIL